MAQTIIVFREKMIVIFSKNSILSSLLYSHLYPLNPYASSTALFPALQNSVPSTIICTLYDPLSLLRLDVPAMALCLSTALCPLYGPPPLRFFGPSTALCPLQPSVLYSALCPLYGPLLPLWPSAPSMTLCSFYDLLSPLLPSENIETNETTPLLQTPRVIAIIAIIAIIAHAKYSGVNAK
jgi:hypothetical protein